MGGCGRGVQGEKSSEDVQGSEWLRNLDLTLNLTQYL